MTYMQLASRMQAKSSDSIGDPGCCGSSGATVGSFQDPLPVWAGGRTVVSQATQAVKDSQAQLMLHESRGGFGSATA